MAARSKPSTLDVGQPVASASKNPVAKIVPRGQPSYHTRWGACYEGDSLRLLEGVPTGSVNLVFTSPPFALTFKKAYGNEDAANYGDWFLPFAEQVHRVLADDGSFVVDLGGAWNPGSPTRSLYQFELLLRLCRPRGPFHLAQEFFWFNPAKLPAPAEWVNVRRIRVKDAVNYVFWLSKSEWPKADNRAILQSYSEDMLRLMQRGYRAKLRPSGHNITEKFGKNHGGSIPPNFIDTREDWLKVLVGQSAGNLLDIGSTESNSDYLRRCEESGQKAHPARFPRRLPDTFIKFLTNEGDAVVDIFAGSNTTGSVAEELKRRWVAFELKPEYVANSKLRFPSVFGS